MKHKLPPLPETEYGLSHHDEGGSHDTYRPGYSDNQMEAYAIAAIEAQAIAVQQKPVFWYDEEDGLLYAPNEERPSGCIPLYTHPAQQAKPQPLSDEKKQKLIAHLRRQEGWDGEGWDLAIIEATEATLGITKE